MTGKRISELNVTPTPVSLDALVPLVVDGVTVRTSVRNLINALVPVNNYAGGRVPTVTDDISEGFSAGSLWIDDSDSPIEAYRCADAQGGVSTGYTVTQADFSAFPSY